MKTFMFPGQGSQAKGMGAALFDEFRELTDQADAMLGYSLRELCLEDPRNELNRTEFTQPALYVVNALSWYRKTQGSGARPDVIAGHSLGEFNALLAAGCFDFATGLQLVQKRSRLMAGIGNGAMAAILNATAEEIDAILRANGIGNIDIANYNTPSQIVISGAADEIAQAQPLFQQGNMLYFPLNTSGAFHSRFMRPVQAEFREFLAGFAFADPKIPVIANVTARPYESGAIVDNLTTQLASNVRWSESMQYLLALGTGRAEPVEFEEIGFGDVLTRLIQTIRRQSAPQTLEAIVRDERAAQAPADTAHVTNRQAGAPPATAGAKVSLWNRKYPVGTRVRSLIADYANLETRTEALVLFGHRAAVYLQGYNGYFDLDELLPE